MNRNNNMASALTAATTHSIIGSGWFNSDYRYRSFNDVRRGPSKALKRARKAQRLARRNNRSAK